MFNKELQESIGLLRDILATLKQILEELSRRG